MKENLMPMMKGISFGFKDLKVMSQYYKALYLCKYSFRYDFTSPTVVYRFTFTSYCEI